MEIGSTILDFDLLESTNKTMYELIQEGLVQPGTVVRAGYQTNGRGQRGTTWDSAASNNLLFSLYLDSRSIGPDEQFAISRGLSIAMCEALQPLVGEAKLEIKWPNDILLDGRKLCGFLIENSIKGNKLEWTIVGIGLNVNQVDYGKLKDATSLSVQSGRNFDLDDLLGFCLEKLNVYWKRVQSFENLNDLYLSKLYGFSRSVPVVIDGESKEIQIQGVDAYGRLLGRVGEEERRFDLKELRFSPIAP